MDQKIYQLFKASKLENGIIRHNVQMYGEEMDFRYQCVRIGFTFPTTESPPFFVVGGMEVEDKFAPSLYGVVRIIQEFEAEDLSLDSAFEAISDSYTSMLAEAIYVDQSQKDYYMRLWNFLDKRNLRSVNVYDIPYRDVIFRFTALKDFDRAGALMVDKGSPLYEDLQSLSKEHLRDNPETKFYRINALSYLISGLQKNPPFKPLGSGGGGHRVSNGWMRGLTMLLETKIFPGKPEKVNQCVESSMDSAAWGLQVAADDQRCQRLHNPPDGESLQRESGLPWGREEILVS